jgi:hypothetical protein
VLLTIDGTHISLLLTLPGEQIQVQLCSGCCWTWVCGAACEQRDVGGGWRKRLLLLLLLLLLRC